MSTKVGFVNDAIQRVNVSTFESLSNRGKRIFFNDKGVFAQGGEGALYGDVANATLGVCVNGKGITYLEEVYDCFNKDVMKPNDIFPYAAPAGLPKLRNVWREWQYLNGLRKDISCSLPVVTNAITNALYTCGLLFLDEGDTIVLPDKFWGNYKLMFETNIGAKIEKFEFFTEDYKSFNLESFRKKLDELIERKVQKAVVILNFPSNPTGYTVTETEAAEITKTVTSAAEKGLKIVVLLDEAYFGTIYEEGIQRTSLFNDLAVAHERLLAVKLDGATKELFMWGFRIGFITFGVKNGTKELYDALENKVAGILRSSLSNISKVSQSAVVNSLKNLEAVKKSVDKQTALLKAKYKIFKNEVQKDEYKSIWKVYESNSGYFVMLKLHDVNAEELREYLLRLYRIGIVALSGSEIRITYASIDKPLLLHVIHKIAMAIEDIKFSPDLDMSVLDNLNNIHVTRAVKHAVYLCKPDKVRFFQDDDESKKTIRNLSLEFGEEEKLEKKGHTIHFDSYLDQGRDRKNTRVLKKNPKDKNYYDKTVAMKELLMRIRGIMRGKVMIVRFYCLGPTNSKFSRCALQMTDSAYVVHSEDILYRLGFEEFKRLNGSENFFTFIHSAGQLDADKCTTEASIHDRRIFIDHEENIVYSINNQYAGNSLACKKLALRLGVVQAHKEGWLAEHVFISGFTPKGKDRKTYFSGAFPSACGKTSTSMLEGGQVVGDDISYLREVNGAMRGVNIEKGVFGIIKNLCARDDPVIHKALMEERELIFSNILVHEGKPYWTGNGVPAKDSPSSGRNFAQGRYSCNRRRENREWNKGDIMDWGDAVAEIPISHSNSRFTISIEELNNKDEALHDPEGVVISGILYGGRDYDAAIPVVECSDWDSGVFAGATIESVTTSASLDKAGAKKVDVMSISDFLIIPTGEFLKGHYEFGKKLAAPPRVFSVNYFLQEYDFDTTNTEDFKFLSNKSEKRIWVLWAEGRVNGEYQDAIKTPLGYIPSFSHLKELYDTYFPELKFDQVHYNELFTFRCSRYIEKFERITAFHRQKEQESGVEFPEQFWQEMTRVISEIKELMARSGGQCQVPPKMMTELYPFH